MIKIVLKFFIFSTLNSEANKTQVFHYRYGYDMVNMVNFTFRLWQLPADPKRMPVEHIRCGRLGRQDCRISVTSLWCKLELSATLNEKF
jgi:hypothetical protein